MARKKLPEFTAKQLLFQKLDMPYHGLSILGSTKEDLKVLDKLDKTKWYVVKVDQGVKKRGKSGLIGVKVSPYKIRSYITDFAQKGYSRFLVEEFVPHDVSEERYLSIERTREGILVRYSLKGGMDVEEHMGEVESRVISYSFSDERSSHLNGSNNTQQISHSLGISETFLQTLLSFFDEEYVSFLEINPLVIPAKAGIQSSEVVQDKEWIPDQVRDDSFYILDLAIEVDSAGEFFVRDGWSGKDFVEDPSSSGKTPEEKFVVQLKENSQASLKLDVLNPNGSLFTLLSGGGASITLADEAYNRGFGKELANYADYSGNPNQEETYLYTKQLLSLLLKSKAHKKALIIAGGVANFTDVRVTFRGILQALQEVAKDLQQQHVKVFVRRGGPNQVEGLHMMSDFLQNNDLYGGVWDQTMVLTDVVNKAIAYVSD